MKFYVGQHKYYCGIDLHTNKMYLCVLDREGRICLHKNLKTSPAGFLLAIELFREDVVVAVECIFTWYWIADLCEQENIPSHKIAVRLRGGMLPQAYVYPARMRATRDLLRRRNHFMHKRAELLAHIQNTRSQYNLPQTFGRIARPQNRAGISGQFPQIAVQHSIAANLQLISVYDKLLDQLEREIIKTAQHHDPVSYALLKTIPGVGRILALVMLYEIEDISRFPRVQDFASYCRLVKCAKESNGKKYGSSGKKIGNAHLKWAFSEASVLFLKGNEPGRKYLEKLTLKHGKGKALAILAHKLGRAVYFMLKRKEAFDQAKFLGI